MQLAADPITIEIAGEAYELRPTLRAATRLARRHRNFAAIYKAILADHVSIIAEVIREGTDAAEAVSLFLVEHEIPNLRAKLDGLKLQLLRYVLALAGHDGNHASPTADAGKPMSFAEYHAELFRIGTGWLGWTPDETWNATPAEIIEARAGRMDMLRAIYGRAEDDAGSAPQLDAEFDRVGFEALKANLRGF